MEVLLVFQKIMRTSMQIILFKSRLTLENLFDYLYKLVYAVLALGINSCGAILLSEVAIQNCSGR